MPDTTRPYIVRTTPGSNETGYTPYANVYIQFSERMLDTTINAVNIGIYRDPLVLVSTTLSYNDGLKLLTITPASALSVDTRYSVVISGGVSDLVGNTLMQNYWFNFWTGTPSGWVVPGEEQLQPEGYNLDGYLEVDRTTPTNYSTNVDISNLGTIRIYFKDDIAIGSRNYLGDGRAANPLMIV